MWWISSSLGNISNPRRSRYWNNSRNPGYKVASKTIFNWTAVSMIKIKLRNSFVGLGLSFLDNNFRKVSLSTSCESFFPGRENYLINLGISRPYSNRNCRYFLQDCLLLMDPLWCSLFLVLTIPSWLLLEQRFF